MAEEFIVIQLDQEQKALILEKASCFIYHKSSTEDLKNRRKKNIRFTKSSLKDVIGELCYYFNRSNDNYEFMVFDELISHLEYCERMHS